MSELGLVFAIIAFFIITIVLYNTVSLFLLARIGAVLLVGGLILTVVPSIVYHRKLYRLLRQHNEWYKRWYVHPLDASKRLAPELRKGLQVWLIFGLLAFAIAIIGLVLLGLDIIFVFVKFSNL